MVKDLVGTLVILMFVFYGTGGDRNEIGITKDTETSSVLANRLRDLEKSMHLNSQCSQEIDKLKEEIDSLKTEHRYEMDSSRMEINKMKQELKRLKGDRSPNFTVEQNHVSPDKPEEAVADDTNRRKHMASRFQRYLLNDLETSVGFTAYIDHTIQHLGLDQTLIFNRVLFNDGSAYNNSSGIFTCPVNGVYLFFFEVGSGAQKQIVAKLVANNVNEVDAIADAEYHQYHEAQGSNMAILRLGQGTQVWVENYRWTDRGVEGDPTERFSTFSGILLYPS